MELIFQKTLQVLIEAWAVFGQMAPYLLFGFLMAGVLSVVVTPETVERHLGGKGFGGVAKASLFGVPLPLCSCGVIPVAASLRRHGATKGATAAFLLSTPQTGVDSILATYALLGPVYAVFRPVAALLSGILCGTVVDCVDPGPAGAKVDACTDACCSTAAGQGRVRRIVQYGFVTLPEDIGRALLAGILISGLMTAFIGQDFLAGYLGSGLIAMFLMVLVGIPIYVCSTASIPIAFSLMHAGISPGAALVFLVAGPATNAAAIATIWKVLGRKTAVVYLATVVVTAIGSGLLLDKIMNIVPPVMQVHAEHHGATAAHHIAALILLGVLLNAIAQRWRHSDATATISERNLVFKIEGMRCDRCRETIERTLTEAQGVESAKVDLHSGKAVVTGGAIDPTALIAAIEELGYEARVA
ncbi:MAG: permease [Verrucomicrobia bacterium]|nr:permease [Verrucomicrobiota bacterium]